MTRTVILDEDERDRRMADTRNEIICHCRIGKVEVKPVLLFTPAFDFKPEKPSTRMWM